MKRFFKSICMVTLGSCLVFTGCSKRPENIPSESESKIGNNTMNQNKQAKTTISVFYGSGMAVEGIVEEITDEFMKENPDINVEFVGASNDYESLMKVKMASQNMPDVFSTHGWAKGRYGDFLADLSGEEWASRVNESIRPLISDETGKLYVLPIDEDKTGYIYNKAILDEYNIEVPTTFDEFIKACEIIVEKSDGKIAPVHIGGGEAPIMSNFYNYIASPLLITHENNQIDALKDGSFDWNDFAPTSEVLLTMKERGYLNKDVLTAKGMDTINALAKGEAVFSVTQGTFALNEAKKVNPEFKGGLMPIPTMHEGDTPAFIGGEFLTWGVWKDSENIEAAKKYVAYFAKPENMKKLSEANGRVPGLTGVDVELGELQEFYEMYKDTRVFPYFDREYLPGGMWGPMGSYGQELLSGGITIEKYNESLEQEYQRLLK